MSDYAIVLTSYRVDDQALGGLGIIGPKRMDYGKAIATVQYVSDILSDRLARFRL
jgi:heat-inducible transcriptional repressor